MSLLIFFLVAVAAGHGPKDQRPIYPAHVHHSHSPPEPTARTPAHTHANDPTRTTTEPPTTRQHVTFGDADHTSHAPITECVGCTRPVRPSRHPHNHHTHATGVTYRAHAHHSHGAPGHITKSTLFPTTTRPHHHHTHKDTGNKRPIYYPHTHHDHGGKVVPYGPCYMFSASTCRRSCAGAESDIMKLICYNNCCSGNSSPLGSILG